MKQTVENLQKAAEENCEEQDYLTEEIQQMTGISLDEETSAFFFKAN